MAEYQNVWLGPDRLVKIGPYELSRYCGSGLGPCPEVQPGGYDEQIEPWLAQVNAERSLTSPSDTLSHPMGRGEGLTPFRFLNQYLYCGDYADLKADGQTLGEFFKNDRAVRESGHDTTHRFDDRTTDFVSIDLNSLLYKYETDFADLIETQFGGRLPGVSGEQAEANYWRQQATKRKAAMMALMWDEQRGYFFDYDFVNDKRSTYISATGLWPLWAKMLDTNNPEEMADAKRTAAFAGEKLEQKAGLVGDGAGIRRVCAHARSAPMGLSLRLGAAPDARVAGIQELWLRCRRVATRISLAILHRQKCARLQRHDSRKIRRRHRFARRVRRIRQRRDEI